MVSHKKVFEMPIILLPNCIHDIYFVGHQNILPHNLIINQRNVFMEIFHIE